MLKERKIKNILRGRSEEEIIIRFDSDDLVKLSCRCRYDTLCGKDGNEVNEVIVARKIEIKKSDGSWSNYPSVTWLDGVENEKQFVSRVLIKKGRGGFAIMSSPQGAPDGKLFVTAKRAGVYTEIVDA